MKYFKVLFAFLRDTALVKFLYLVLVATAVYLLTLFLPWNLDITVATAVAGLLIWIIYIVTRAAFLSAEKWAHLHHQIRHPDAVVGGITLTVALVATLAATVFVALILFTVSQLGWVELK
jgi:hypothetical protein